MKYLYVTAVLFRGLWRCAHCSFTSSLHGNTQSWIEYEVYKNSMSSCVWRWILCAGHHWLIQTLMFYILLKKQNFSSVLTILHRAVDFQEDLLCSNCKTIAFWKTGKFKKIGSCLMLWDRCMVLLLQMYVILFLCSKRQKTTLLAVETCQSINSAGAKSKMV